MSIFSTIDFISHGHFLERNGSKSRMPNKLGSQEMDNNAILLTIFNATLIYQFVDFKLSKNFDFLLQLLWQNDNAKGQNSQKQITTYLVLISSKK